MRRVVITGMGAVAPNGIGVKKYWDSLVNGISCVRRIKSFDVTRFSTQIAGEVPGFDPLKFIEPKKAKRMSRFAQFAVAAAKMAKEDSKLIINEENTRRIGVIIGTSSSDMYLIEKEEERLLKGGPSAIKPLSLPAANPHGAAANLCIEFNIKGRSLTIATGCTSSLNALGYAFEAIRLGNCDAVFAGGTEAPITPLIMGGFCSGGVLSRRNEDPERASRPFDKNRDGYIVGEGAGVLVLEDYEHAVGRNARIYAEISGYANTTDAYSMFQVEPSGDESVECFASACRQAGLNSGDVDYISAHGSSSKLSDERETMVIKKCLGEHSKKVMVSSIKSMIGHPLGAAGSLQTIASVSAMNDGLVPPTINYEEKDSFCDLDYVPNEARKSRVKVAVVNSLGMGGNNAVLVMKYCNN